MAVTGETRLASRSRSSSAGHSAMVSSRNCCGSVLRDFMYCGGAHRADAGGAVGQGNEPEPAVLEPEQADVAFVFPGRRVAPEKWPNSAALLCCLLRCLMPRRLAEKSVAARSIGHEAGSPLLLQAVFQPRGRRSAPSGWKSTPVTRQPSIASRAFARRVAEQDLDRTPSAAPDR